ncbi:MAG: hypothetical protein ABI589_13665 [Burkholderiales bacterium]
MTTEQSALTAPQAPKVMFPDEFGYLGLARDDASVHAQKNAPPANRDRA